MLDCIPLAALAQAVPVLPEGPGWWYEPKCDGHRTVLRRADETVVLYARSGRVVTQHWMDLAVAGMTLRPGTVLDGGAVIWRDGRLDFAAAQSRAASSVTRARALAARHPASYICWDVLQHPDPPPAPPPPQPAPPTRPPNPARQALPGQAPSLRELPEPPDAVKARELLTGLVVADEDDVPGCSRSMFPHWVTQYGTCDIRDVVLQRDGRDVVRDDQCRAVSGTWYSEYDGLTIASASGIDHVVLLKEAWRSGRPSGRRPGGARSPTT
ncbi:hypothetical protein [Streptomyces sp. NPDC004728]|uniref:ATP-dependent DNA ligase n=1 Tax=Streptomyces sp. NPDC004728 TaxID=3154289 RepID=UPI0033B5B62B